MCVCVWACLRKGASESVLAEIGTDFVSILVQILVVVGCTKLLNSFKAHL